MKKYICTVCDWVFVPNISVGFPVLKYVAELSEKPLDEKGIYTFSGNVPSYHIGGGDIMRECNFGLFEGKNYQELTGNPKYQSWIDSGGTKAFPGGEDPMEFRKRCVCGFEEMMEKMIKGKRKKIAFVVHGGTIMSVMEAFDPEKKEFYHWQVKNGKGFHFQIEEEKWQQGNRQFEEIEEI